MDTLLASPIAIHPYLTSLLRWYYHRFPKCQRSFSSIFSQLFQAVITSFSPTVVIRRGRPRKVTEIEKKRSEEINKQQENQQPVAILVLLRCFCEFVRFLRNEKKIGMMEVKETMIRSLITECWKKENRLQDVPQMATLAKMMVAVRNQ